VDLGSSFLRALQASSISESERKALKLRGKDFLKEIFCGLQTRVGGVLGMMHNLKDFSFENFFATPFSSAMFPSPFFPQNRLALAELEEKTKLLKTLSFTSSSTEAFWCEVHNFQDAAGNFPFRQLSSGVIRMLCLPISNAEVERVFSQVTLVKNSRRAALNLDLLESILFCKFGLSKFGKSAKDFKPTTKMLQFDSSIYD